MVDAVRGQGKRAAPMNVPYANEAVFSPRIAKELHAQRDYHNAQLRRFCDQQGITLANICSRLGDRHFADELHPNEAGARFIAEEVFQVLRRVHKGDVIY